MPTGVNAYDVGIIVRGRPLLQLNSLSGGVQLLSGAIASVTLKNLTGNGDVYVGGSGTGNAPYSGYGFLLAGGEGISLGLRNFTQVSLFAANSGDFVTYFGVATV